MTAPSPPPKRRPAPSSSSSTGEESDDEMTAPSPSPKSRPAPKNANSSSSAPKPHKPSSTSTSAAQSPKPKPSAAAAPAAATATAQGPKPKPSSTSTVTQGPKPNPPKPSSASEDEDDKKEDDSSEDEDYKNEEDSYEDEDGSEEEVDPKDDSDEESSDSESDDDRSNPPPQQPQPPLKSTTTKASGSGSTDDSGSESSDQPPPSPRRSSRVADPSIKPITSKPMDVPSKLSKPASIAASNQDSKGPDKKKQKVPEASENGNGGPKRQLFQRIWSEEDEISTLQGMIDYHAKKGTVPSSTDMDAFHDFIHKSLQMEVSKTQLADKVRRFKKKYVTAAARGKNGVDPSFTKAHEQTAYELSKKIWEPKKILSKDSDGDVGDNSTRKLRKIKEELDVPTSVAIKTNEEDDSVKVKFPYPLLMDAVSQMTNGLPIGLAAKRALELIDFPKAMALENKYKKLRLSEMKHHMHRMDLTKEIVKMTMGAIEKLS